MYGPGILARSMSAAAPFGKSGAEWQYHPRSDRHSKIACWGVLFDLLQHCPTLVRQIEDGTIAFGINHEMKDFRLDRKKNLDLVLCTPRSPSADAPAPPVRSFRALVDKYGILLSPEERALLNTLPDLPAAPVGAVHVALEAKACMTEHMKARPRLYDELNSSHATIHGNSDKAIAVGFVMVNMAAVFRSPTARELSKHRQPDVTEKVIEKVKQLPRRASPKEDGFDAMAIVVVRCQNDRTPVELVTDAPAPQPGDIFHYDAMVQRLADLYSWRQQ
ncbi:hypothetical protein [Anaeromyxobacter oryzae]|uniref:Uncharacterized protein n=1 Tax=Anaeromyxobacter oryzae TaxID=2918170 RepID=A0ABM7WTM2_9BACT|nr:hypothetical protein [Anaeromyxobacter oryzae]BDG02824.1 hypothetical protein AMOR_18200 [Anaeromyxobacter oryzae]